MEEIKTKKKEPISKKIRENPWMLSTFVFGILAIILIINAAGITGNVSGDKAGENFVTFFNEQTEGDISYVSSADLGDNLYDITFLIEGQEIPGQITKDGKYFVQVLYEINPDEPTTTVPPTTQQPTDTIAYTEADLVKLSEFSTCLANAGMKVYGANWCGWTQKLVVDTLGGFDNAGDLYVECTEETELCSSEEITGYPTIKVNGEVYKGERTLESLAAATGCTAPELEGNAGTDTSSDEGNC